MQQNMGDGHGAAAALDTAAVTRHLEEPLKQLRNPLQAAAAAAAAAAQADRTTSAVVLIFHQILVW
jgi:hypothetical protein